MRDDDFLDQIEEVISMVRILRKVDDSVTNTNCSIDTWKNYIVDELFSFRDKALKKIRSKTYFVLKYKNEYITKVGHKLPDVITSKYLADKVINFSSYKETEQFLIRHQWLIDSIEIKEIKKGYFDEWEEVEND